jgi:hypothetical protein
MLQAEVVGQETETKFTVINTKVTDAIMSYEHFMPKYFKPSQLLKFRHTEKYV